MMGTAFNLAVYAVPNINWRLMLGAPFLPAVPLLSLIFFCPESPRWYMKKGRYFDAWQSMMVLRHHPIQVARDIYYISAQLELEKQIVGKTNYATRFGQLFTIPRVRRANLAAFTVMIAQQMCGINIIAFYSTSIFTQSGLDARKAMIGSFGFGVVNWLFAFPAFWTIDTVGSSALAPHRWYVLTPCSLADAACFCLRSRKCSGLSSLQVFALCSRRAPRRTPTRSERVWCASLSTYSAVSIPVHQYPMASLTRTAFYSPGEGPVPYTYSAEVYPLSHRETGMGFAVANCLFWVSTLPGVSDAQR